MALPPRRQRRLATALAAPGVAAQQRRRRRARRAIAHLPAWLAHPAHSLPRRRRLPAAASGVHVHVRAVGAPTARWGQRHADRRRGWRRGSVGAPHCSGTSSGVGGDEHARARGSACSGGGDKRARRRPHGTIIRRGRWDAHTKRRGDSSGPSSGVGGDWRWRRARPSRRPRSQRREARVRAQLKGDPQTVLSDRLGWQQLPRWRAVGSLRDVRPPGSALHAELCSLHEQKVRTLFSTLFRSPKSETVRTPLRVYPDPLFHAPRSGDGSKREVIQITSHSPFTRRRILTTFS